MRRSSNLFFYSGLAFFSVWCGFALKEDLARFSWSGLWESRWTIVLAGSLSLANYFLRICRWALYLNRSGNKLTFGFVALTYTAGFAFTISPGKMGEMIRARYYRDCGIPLSKSAAAFFVERLLDLFAMVALALLALSSSSEYRVVLMAAVVVILIPVLGLGFIPWSRWQTWLEQSKQLPSKIGRILFAALRTLTAARNLLHPSLLVTGFLIGLLAWACEGVGLQVISHLVKSPPAMGLADGLGIYSVATLIGALSFLPGGLGSTEAVMTALLVKLGYELPDALMLTFACRILTLWLAVGIGWLAVLILRIHPQTGQVSSPAHGQFIMSESSSPLCVDLDGTLIHSDLLLESFVLLMKRNPFYLFAVPLWLIKGKAGLKAEIARRVKLNPKALPYNQLLIPWLNGQRDKGRPLWLCTASNYRLADRVAAHLGFFEGVLASSDSNNLSGSNKARVLVERFGQGSFEYCGNHSVDIPIWAVSGGAVVVNGDAGLTNRVQGLVEVRGTFPRESQSPWVVLRALRLHQWAKNILVFLPLLASHKFESDTIQQALSAFLAFGLCASSVYILNDMLDLEADRQHPRKRKRPFAAGDLSLLVGFGLVPLLLLLAVLQASFVNVEFVSVLVIYYIVTLFYSLWIKRVVLVDIFALAALYTVRIVAGGVAVSVPLSFWMILFSIFLFLSLALAKRYTELDSMRREGKFHAAGRGYLVEDLPLLLSLGAASGYLCVLVMALYIHSPEIVMLYSRPQWIWFLCPLLAFWVSRIWLAAHRGRLHDDPVVFAVKDKVSLLVGTLTIAVMFFAL